MNTTRRWSDRSSASRALPLGQPFRTPPPPPDESERAAARVRALFADDALLDGGWPVDLAAGSG